MKKILKEIEINSTGRLQFFDVSSDVDSVVKDSGIKDGIVIVSSKHTTAGIKITEKCERLQKDMINFLDKTIPAGKYFHDEETVDNRPNARMHIQALFMNSSETVVLSDGTLMLGTWQSIFFVELDGPRDGRKVLVSIMGE